MQVPTTEPNDIPEICHFFDTSTISTDTKNTPIPDFLTLKKHKIHDFTQKHTNSHFL